uniref:Uncharacterized protein n=1 Tax=Cacopsylla melanoneura TaxID=428564 RepID=A0A8D9B6V8_9HEMI
MSQKASAPGMPTPPFCFHSSQYLPGLVQAGLHTKGSCKEWKGWTSRLLCRKQPNTIPTLIQKEVKNTSRLPHTKRLYGTDTIGCCCTQSCVTQVLRCNFPQTVSKRSQIRKKYSEKRIMNISSSLTKI